MTLLPMENKEGIICALKCFEKDKPNNIPPVLEDYIRQVARNGRTMLPWLYIKPLLLHKFNKVVDNFFAETSPSDYPPVSQSSTELKQRVYDSLKQFDGIPFTIQRICELFDSPFRHYSRPEKFLRGLEKVCMVVSTIDPQGNKIHLEDPRFPSQAGLDDSGLIINETLLSPPTSPDIDELHRPKQSKSSDEEEATDEDDNEEGENDRHVESSTLHKTEDLLGQPPILTNSPASGVWPFGRTALNDTSMSKLHFRNLITDSPIPSRKYTAEKSLTNEPLDAEYLADSQPSVSDDSPTAASCGSTLDKPGIKSEDASFSVDDDNKPSPNLSKDNDVSNLPFEPRLTDSGVSDSFRTEINDQKTAISVESPAIGSQLSESVEDYKAFQPDEPVPPIIQVLRPIGQLEAFVQNMGAEVSSSSSIPELLFGRKGDESCEQKPGFAEEHAMTRVSSPTSNEPVKSSERSPVVSAGTKRRASSPVPEDLQDSAAVNSHVVSNPDFPLAEHQESPAKRRRLADSSPATPDCDGRVSTPTVIPAALNDSPPIIVCNPLFPTRDCDSGEQNCSQSPSNSSQGDQPEERKIDNENTANDEGEEEVHTEDLQAASQSSSPPLPPTTASADTEHHINSETGEEES